MSNFSLLMWQNDGCFHIIHAYEFAVKLQIEIQTQTTFETSFHTSDR